MPEQLHPPYGAATLQPRQLNRWLDVNAQNGPLRRTQTYIVIPAFAALNVDWKGYSEIIAVINYTSPQNFSFSEIPHYLNVYNTMICVAFQDIDGSIKRYILNPLVQRTVYFDLQPYTNQIIRKNFRLEFWSIEAINIAIQANSPPIYTSVLGERDYRYGDDSALASMLPITSEIAIDGTLDGGDYKWLFPMQFPAGTAFIPQNAVIFNEPGPTPGNPVPVGVISVLADGTTKAITVVDDSIVASSEVPPSAPTPVGVIPIVDLATGTTKYARVIDDSIVISAT